MALLERIIAVYKTRLADMAKAISEEMGAPLAKVATPLQAPSGLGHFMVALGVLKDFEFEKMQGTTKRRARAGRRVRPHHAVELACEPDRVQGGAGARGRLHDGAEAERNRAALRRTSSPRSCTRPVCRRACSTWSTATARRSARRISSHPGIDMVSFTGSTRAGILVDKAAADTVKKVALELGGKSPNIILEGAPLPSRRSVTACW